MCLTFKKRITSENQEPSVSIKYILITTVWQLLHKNSVAKYI